MAGKVVDREQLRQLAADVAFYASEPFQVGLFTNDLDDEDDELEIGDVTPATFGGYSGLQDLDDWGSVLWDTDHAVCEHAPVVWTANGASTNTIRGFYVVDGDGELAWVFKAAGGGQVVGTFNGQTFTIFPERRTKDDDEL